MTLASPTAPPGTSSPTPEVTPVPTSTPPDQWLRVEKAAEHFGLDNPRTLYRLTAKRKVPFRRLPGTRIIAFAPEDMKAIADMSLVRPLGIN